MLLKLSEMYNFLRRIEEINWPVFIFMFAVTEEESKSAAEAVESEKPRFTPDV
jgi:hypothetical protein